MTDLLAHITATIEDSIATKARALALAPQIARAADLLVDAYARGGKAMFFGNGGSAADAQHLAAEFECRFAFDRRPLPALALHANSSTLSAIGNDYDFTEVFTRPLRAHARPGDVAVAITTSGRSKNVIAAARLCKELDIKLVALTGAHTDVLAPLADIVIGIPSTVTARIQECHVLVGHILCEAVERALFARSPGLAQVS